MKNGLTEPGLGQMRGYVALYLSNMDACRVDEEKAAAREGDFYSGWISSDIIAPSKGVPGTRGW